MKSRNLFSCALKTLLIGSCAATAQTGPSFTVNSVSGNYVITCASPVVSLTANSNHSSTVSYSWAGPSGTATGASYNVTQAGNYTVSASSGAGTSSQSLTIFTNTVPPLTSVSPTYQIISCSMAAQQATAVINPTVNVMHQWISPTGAQMFASSATSFYQPGSTGTYTHIGTNLSNGCSTVRLFTVFANNLFPTFSVIAQPHFSIGCNSQSMVVVSIVNAQTQPSGGAVSYTLLAPGASPSLPPGALSSQTNYTLTTPGTYTVAVRDIANGCTSRTAFSILTNTVPPAISVSVSHSQICQGQTVTITASGAHTYTISGGVTNGVAFSPASTAAYVVHGTDLNGCSSSSAVTISVTPLPAFSYTINGLQVSYSITAGCDNFIWEYGNNTTSSVDVNPAISYSAAGIYTACLKCVSSTACSSCVSLTLTGSSTVGILEDARVPEFRCFPNPFSGKMTIVCKDQGKLSLFSITGMKVLEKATIAGENRFDTGFLPGGIYIIKIEDSGYEMYKKVINSN